MSANQQQVAASEVTHASPAEFDLNSLYVSTQGSGPRELVMLHGWGRSHIDFLPLARLLQLQYRSHIFDLPGFGRSPAPATAWGTSDYAELILRYLDANNIEHCDLLGHSFGGRICCRLASTHPERFKQMILIGSHGLSRELTPRQQIRARAIGLLRSTIKTLDSTVGSSLFQNYFVPRFGSRDYLAAGEMRGTLVKTVTEDQTDNVRNIQARTLLLWGAEDAETPPAMGERFSELIPNARLIMIDGADHYPFLDIGSHLTAFYIKAFLQNSPEDTRNVA